MAPKGRDGALVALKGAFEHRFGPALKDVIEAEVEGHLVGRDRLEREDIDAIERRILAAKRQQRGGGGGRRRAHARSAPNLLDLAPAGSTQVPSAPSTAPPPPHSLTSPPAPAPGQPGGRQPPRLARSSSETASQRAPLLARHLKTSSPDRKLPEPPYGVSISDLRDDVSERSRVQVVPKYPVPKKPKLKPMEHWDLLIAFDAQKHQQDSQAFASTGKGDAHRRFRATLDGQMVEVRALREQEAEGKRQDREGMRLTVESNQRLTQMEEDAVQQKRDKMKQANDEMTLSIQQRRQRAQAQKQREQDQMLHWLESERARKEEEERHARIEYARKCKTAREELEAMHEEAARRRKAEQDADRAIAAAQVKAMDQAESNNRAAVKARMDQIERNCKTIGADIADRDARMERELQAKIKKVQEEADRTSKEDVERRQREHKQRVDEMLSSLDRQMREREALDQEEKEAGRRQAEVWRQQQEDGTRRDREKAESMRRAREELDAALIEQIREANSVHPRNFLVNKSSQKADVAYNRALFEHMSKEGYRNDVIDRMLAQASGHSKLDPFPSVARYDGPIHEMELQVPEG